MPGPGSITSVHPSWKVCTGNRSCATRIPFQFLCQPFGPGFGIHVFRNVIATVRQRCMPSAMYATVSMSSSPRQDSECSAARAELLLKRQLVNLSLWPFSYVHKHQATGNSNSMRAPESAKHAVLGFGQALSCWAEVKLKDYVGRRFCRKCRGAQVSLSRCEELLDLHDLPNHTEVCAACLSAPVHQLYGYTVTTPELRTDKSLLSASRLFVGSACKSAVTVKDPSRRGAKGENGFASHLCMS